MAARGGRGGSARGRGGGRGAGDRQTPMQALYRDTIVTAQQIADAASRLAGRKRYPDFDLPESAWADPYEQLASDSYNAYREQLANSPYYVRLPTAKRKRTGLYSDRHLEAPTHADIAAEPHRSLISKAFMPAPLLESLTSAPAQPKKRKKKPQAARELLGENGEKYEKAALDKQAIESLVKQDRRDRGEVESDGEAEESDGSQDSLDDDYNAEQYFSGGEDEGPSGDEGGGDN